jgi:hypothetical protein
MGLYYPKQSGTTIQTFAIGAGNGKHPFILDASSFTSSHTWKLPNSNGGSGYVLETDGSGNLSWVNPTTSFVTSVSSGTGISVSGSTGAVTIGNTGVTAVASTLSGVTFSASTGSVTLSGTLGEANGGTGASLTNIPGAIVYGGASVMAFSAAGTSGYALVSGGTGAPTWAQYGGLKLYAENPSSPTAPSVTGTNAVAIGTGSAAANTNGFAVGSGTSTTNYGARVYANGDFATAGDAQALHVLYRLLTNTVTASQEMFLDGSVQRLVLPANSAWTFTLRCVARDTTTSGNSGSWIFNGMILRNAGAPTVYGLSKTTIARNGNFALANDPVVTADGTNNSLKIAVTPPSTDNIRWVVDCELVQVTN